MPLSTVVEEMDAGLELPSKLASLILSPPLPLPPLKLLLSPVDLLLNNPPAYRTFHAVQNIFCRYLILCKENKEQPYDFYCFLMDLNTRNSGESDCVESIMERMEQGKLSVCANLAVAEANFVKNTLVSSTFVPPASRLVGIELNPGPGPGIKKGRHSKSMKNLASKVLKAGLSSSSSPLRPPQRHAPPGPRGRKRHKHAAHRQHLVPKGSQNAALNAYIDCLIDPWFAPVPRLGFGCFVPTAIRSGWQYVNYPGGALATVFNICATPNMTAGTSVGSTNPATISYFDGANGTASYTVSNITTAKTSYANQATLVNAVQSSRLIAMSLRVIVRYPSTSIRGSLYGGLVSGDTYSDWQVSTSMTMQALSSVRYAVSESAGEIGIEVQYRPHDSSDFIFNAQYDVAAAAGNLVMPCLIIGGVGWPTTTSWSTEVHVIGHYEVLGGFDSAGSDGDASGSLSESGITIDQVGAEGSKIEPVITSISNIEILDAASSNIARARGNGRRATGFGLGNAVDSDDRPNPRLPSTGGSSFNPPSAVPASSSSPSSSFVKVSECGCKLESCMKCL
jgi:hypothetical protein